MKKYLFIGDPLPVLLFVLMFLAACQKDDAGLNAPRIFLISVKPDTAYVSDTSGAYVALHDSVVVKINYTDNDGDLGENKAGKRNMFITNNSIGITDSFRISQLAPLGDNLIVKGLVRAKLNTVLVPNSLPQSITFNIMVQDRAGNKSNVLTSKPIFVKRN